MSASDSRPGIPSRFRLPGIEQLGYAQLSVIETALYPLDRGAGGPTSFSTSYLYSDVAGERQRAEVKVGSAFEPLKANDDFFLWSLLSLTLRYSDNHVLAASPYWLLKNIGLPVGGFQYSQLRQVVERLAQTVYSNTGFYNPITQEHERWTFAFFASHLPETLDEDRLWKLVWNQPFIDVSRATGGRLLFDLDLFHKLGSPATRRLFLKLSDRFYRTNRVFLDVDDLTINGLGFAADRPLKKRKYDLARCIETLLEHRIITLGRGQTSIKSLFLKREKGRYIVVFYKSAYFEKPVTEGTKKRVTDDPLYGPMQTIGIDGPMIRRVLTSCQRSVIERWLRITEAAIKDKPQGFPGFKVSPAAFFIDGVLNERMPPDWMYQLEKAQRQKLDAAERAKMKAVERTLQADYEARRQEALKVFVQTPTGKHLFQSAYDFRLAVNLRQGNPAEIAQRNAADEALDYLGRSDEFSFPEMSVWMMTQNAKI